MSSPLDLNTVRVASPCAAPWDEMIGNNRVRFCSACSKRVYNLRGMSRTEAERLLSERDEDAVPCIRIHVRQDGTILTADCPVGLRSARRKLALLVASTCAMLASALTSIVGDEMAGIIDSKGNSLAWWISPAPLRSFQPPVRFDRSTAGFEDEGLEVHHGPGQLDK